MKFIKINKREVKMQNAKRAIVIVDMLNDFVKENIEGDAEYKGKLVVPGAAGLIEKIGRIRGAAGQQNILVIYATDRHIPKDPEFEVWPEHAVEGTYGAAVVDELAPAENNLVIAKQDLSFFTNREADRLLKQHGIAALDFTGVATEYCVRAGALDAANLGYKVNVVVDAIAGVDLQKGDQYRALLEMGNAGIRPIYTKQLLEEMLK